MAETGASVSEGRNSCLEVVLMEAMVGPEGVYISWGTLR